MNYIRILFVSVFLFAKVSAYELSMLAMFREEARYLKEWIDYHILIGVQHFWLYNDHSIDNFEEVLKPYIEKGIVDLIHWTEGGDGYSYVRQPSIYRDGIQKAIGNTKWLAILDIDEFLIPMKDESVIDTLDKYYGEASAIYINWRNFGTGKVTIPEGGSLLHHLTSCSLSRHPRNLVGKCLVRPECVFLDTLWTPHHYDLHPGGIYFDGNAQPLQWNGKEFEFGNKYCDKMLRVNHYVLRDEYFFWNYRYKRTGDKVLLMEHYDSFNIIKDKAVQKFVKKMHPELFDR